MNSQTKILTLTITTILTLSSLMVLSANPANAQKPSPPSVPEFSVKLVAQPYDVPPSASSTFDTSTWIETTTTQPGYHVENRSIEVKIKNQPFTPYILQTSGYDYAIDLYYLVEVKDHFSEDWHVFRYNTYSYSYNVQSNSEYTIVPGSADYPEGTKLDFRVQAIIGTRYSATAGSLAGMYLGPVDSMTLSASSDWSRVQTLSITGGSVSSSTPNPTTSGSSLSSSSSQAATSLPGNPTTAPPANYNPIKIDFTTQNFPSLITIMISIIALLIGIIGSLAVYLTLLKKRIKKNVAEQ